MEGYHRKWCGDWTKGNSLVFTKSDECVGWVTKPCYSCWIIRSFQTALDKVLKSASYWELDKHWGALSSYVPMVLKGLKTAVLWMNVIKAQPKGGTSSLTVLKESGKRNWIKFLSKHLQGFVLLAPLPLLISLHSALQPRGRGWEGLGAVAMLTAVMRCDIGSRSDVYPQEFNQHRAFPSAQ